MRVLEYESISGSKKIYLPKLLNSNTYTLILSYSHTLILFFHSSSSLQNSTTNATKQPIFVYYKGVMSYKIAVVGATGNVGREINQKNTKGHN